MDRGRRVDRMVKKTLRHWQAGGRVLANKQKLGKFMFSCDCLLMEKKAKLGKFVFSRDCLAAGSELTNITGRETVYAVETRF